MLLICSFFFFNDPATTEIYTLSLHDALPISRETIMRNLRPGTTRRELSDNLVDSFLEDRKSTRLNSSHVAISYAVFCLKKKKTSNTQSKTVKLTITVRSDAFAADAEIIAPPT